MCAQASGVIGHNSSTVQEMHVPYIVPAECASRADTRWVALHHQTADLGVLVMPCPPTPPMQVFPCSSRIHGFSLAIRWQILMYVSL